MRGVYRDVEGQRAPGRAVHGLAAALVLPRRGAPSRAEVPLGAAGVGRMVKSKRFLVEVDGEKVNPPFFFPPARRAFLSASSPSLSLSPL